MIMHESILTENPCYKTGRKITPKGIMLGSVHCPQPSAKVFVHNWNRESCDNRCVHAFIDANSGDVYQTLPWNHRGWHSGKHPRTKMSANGTHIGIVMCEPAQIKYKKADQFEITGDKDKAIAAIRRTYDSAVELCAMLCKEYNFNPATDIISHKEGYEKQISSNHFDPIHLWNGFGLDYTMDKFRADVEKKMKTLPKMTVASTTSEPIKIKVDPAVEPVILNEQVDDEPTERLVRIGVDRLRIRMEPGGTPTGKYTGKGIFAITEIQNGSGSNLGWGKLRNGEGWISLDYVEML